MIRTRFLDSQPRSVVDYMLEKIPKRRTGVLDEAAETLAFIASPVASFTTGLTFDLSGRQATY